MPSSDSLSASAEDYLETILALIADKGAARVRDVADALSVHKSTVSSALRQLSERGYVNYRPYELATLTPRGQSIAEQVSQDHAELKHFLVEVLLLDEETAERHACKMEHVLERPVMQRLQNLADYLATGRSHSRRFSAHLKASQEQAAV